MKRLFFLTMIVALTLGSMASPASIVKGKSNQPMPAANAALKSYNFTLVNKTGYDIKKLYIAPHSSEEWDETDEVLHGQLFAKGASVAITYNARKEAESWD